MKYWLFKINIFGILFLLMFGPMAVLAVSASTGSCPRAFSGKPAEEDVRALENSVNTRDSAGQPALIRTHKAKDIVALLEKKANPDIRVQKGIAKKVIALLEKRGQSRHQN